MTDRLINGSSCRFLADEMKPAGEDTSLDPSHNAWATFPDVLSRSKRLRRLILRPGLLPVSM